MNTRLSAIVAGLALALGLVAGAALGPLFAEQATSGRTAGAPTLSWADDQTGNREAAALLRMRAAEIEAQKSGWQTVPRQKPGESPWVDSLDLYARVSPNYLVALGAVLTLRRHLCDIQWASLTKPKTPSSPVLARFEIVRASHEAEGHAEQGPPPYLLFLGVTDGAPKWRSVPGGQSSGSGFTIEAMLYWVTLDGSPGVPPMAAVLLHPCNPHGSAEMSSRSFPRPLKVRIEKWEYRVKPKQISGRRLNDRAAAYIEGATGWFIDKKDTHLVSSKSVTTRFLNAVVSVFDLSAQRVQGAGRRGAVVYATYHPGRTAKQRQEIETYLRRQMAAAPSTSPSGTPLPPRKQWEDGALGWRITPQGRLEKLEYWGMGVPAPVIPPLERPFDWTGWE